MRVLEGSSNPGLSVAISNILGTDPILRDIRRFPDGEVYCRILEPIEDEDVILVQSTYPDNNAIETLILAGLVKDLGASSVTGVIPYYGYARQDMVFNEGESFTARTMAMHLQLSMDNIVCINLHKEKTLEQFTTLENRTNVSVMGEIGSYLKGLDVDFILSPDKGASGYANEAAEAAGCDYDNLEKTRIDGETVKMAPKDLDVDGKIVAIVDDIIATGGTILRAQEALREQGAKKVYAGCAHGLFTGGGISRLKPVLNGLFSSDTIENPTTKLSAAVPVVDHLRSILR